MKEKISSRMVLAALMITLMASMATTSVLAGDKGSFGYEKDIDPYDLATWEGVPNATDPAGDHVNATVKIVFDNSHAQYYNPSFYDTFIGMLRKNGTVVINNDTITDALLAGVSILVIPDPGSDFIANEAEVIKNWIDNGGSLLIMGTHLTYLDPARENNITLDYGIEFLDTSVLDNDDNTDEPHWPIIYTWSDNAIANYVTNGVESVSAGRTNSLNVSGSAMPIGTGDTDPWDNTTVAVDYYDYTWPPDPGNIVANGTDVITFAAVDIPDGGRIFASGSSAVFTDGSYYIDSSYDNRKLASNVINWLLQEAAGSDIGDILNVWICNNYTHLFVRVDVAGGLPAPDVLPYFAMQLYVEDTNHTALNSTSLMYTNGPIVENDINASFFFAKWSDGGFGRKYWTGSDWGGWVDNPGAVNWTVGGKSFVFAIYLPHLSSTGSLSTDDTFKFEVYTIWSPDGSNWFAQDYLDFATYTLTGPVVPEFPSLIIILLVTPIIAIAIIAAKKRRLLKLA